MIQTQSKLDRNYPTFACPSCGKRDVLYMRMPNRCHWCRQEFPIDLEAMSDYLHARVHYFRVGRTWPVKYYKESEDAKSISTEEG